MDYEQVKQAARPENGGAALRNQQSYHLVKRAIDLILAATLLVVLLPFMLLIAVCIKLDSPGPVLFRQERVGRGLRHFRCYKFRSMFHGVDSKIHEEYIRSFIHNRLDPVDQGQGQDVWYKLEHDPRVTRVGAWLRRTSLDELPQLFNVLRGEMSLVGPRPPLPYEVEEYELWHKGRLQAVPGITGWWQIRGRSRVTFDEMVQMDLDYIARQSLLLDVKILALTIPAVLSKSGAR